MRLSELNEYSQRFANRLLAIYPDWNKHAQADTANNVTPGTLTVEIPAPNAKARALYISTDKEEVMVEFDSWHTHFGDWADSNEEESFAGALELIQQILDEEIVVVTWMDKGKFCGSGIMNADEELKLDEGQHAYVRSWRGTHDFEAYRG